MTTAPRLLLVRHGLPDYRTRIPGDTWPGPPLSDTGREQAAQAAACVAPLKPAAIFCSPFARTRQTADVLVDHLNCPLHIDSGLREWHRTERLYDVAVRLTGWFVRWLRGGPRCAVVVSHASPLLAILRSALYLPHVNWHKPGQPHVLEVSSGDRFEVTMASVFELLIEPRVVTARCLQHASPRIMHAGVGPTIDRLPRPITATGENRIVRRPNFLHLLGGRRPQAR